MIPLQFKGFSQILYQSVLYSKPIPFLDRHEKPLKFFSCTSYAHCLLKRNARTLWKTSCMLPYLCCDKKLPCLPLVCNLLERTPSNEYQHGYSVDLKTLIWNRLWELSGNILINRIVSLYQLTPMSRQLLSFLISTLRQAGPFSAAGTKASGSIWFHSSYPWEPHFLSAIHQDWCW